MEMVWAMYFSATGTTEKIVTAIAERLGEGDFRKYDFTLPGVRSKRAVFESGDVVVFGVPVYAGRVPNVLVKYLNTVEGNGAKAIPVVVYGNRNYDDAGYLYHKTELEEMYARRAEPEVFLSFPCGIAGLHGGQTSFE